MIPVAQRKKAVPGEASVTATSCGAGSLSSPPCAQSPGAVPAARPARCASTLLDAVMEGFCFCNAFLFAWFILNFCLIF